MVIKYIKLENRINNGKENINKKNINYGLALLKSFLSFLVIIIHNFKKILLIIKLF